MGQRVSDRGPLIWGRWNGCCAEGVERAQLVFGVRDVAWGCWWLCRAGGIKKGREVFRASHLSGLPGLSYLVLVVIRGISMDD